MDHIHLNNLRKRLFNRAAIAVFGTFLFNTLGVYLALYWIIWWYDIPMHFFGGLFTGLLVVYILLSYKKTAYIQTFKIILFSLLLTFLITILWEFYEYFIKTILAGEKFDLIDSSSDILFGMIGALQAIFIYKRHKKIVLAQ